MTNLLPQLRSLRPPLWLVRVSGFITRLFEIYFLTVVISFFLGFLNMFSKDEFGQEGFAKFIKGFMYFVMALVILLIVNKRVKTILGERSPERAKNNLLVNSLTVLFSTLVIIAAWFLGTYFLGNEFGIDFMWKWVAGIFSIFILLLPYHLLKGLETKFNSNYKNLVIENFLSSSKLNVSWLKNNFISQDDFTSSKLFTFQNIHSYTGSDMFKRDENNFYGSRLKVMQREVTQSSGKTEIKITEVFNGYLFVADFNKRLNGTTFILPDTSRALLGEVYGEMVNELIKREETKLVKLEDTEFEKNFAVYASDEVEARYILSTKLMERINLFKNNFYQDVFISFAGNKIYIAVSAEKDLFSPHLYGKIDDEDYIRKQYNYFYTLLTIPEQFDLQTRIWL